MPRFISKMTDSHMQLCGCETCYVTKNLTSVLNAYCTRTYKKMIADADKPENADTRQDKLDRAESFKLMTKLEDGSPKWNHPMDFVDLSTCSKVDVGN